MRFLALLQVVVLLSVSLVPGAAAYRAAFGAGYGAGYGGKCRAVGACCGDNCQCAATDRTSGNCCCQRRASGESTVATEAVAVSSLVSTLVSSAAACSEPPMGLSSDAAAAAEGDAATHSGSPLKTLPSCCSAARTGSDDTPGVIPSEQSAASAEDVPPWGAIKSCPCGETPASAAVPMPRVQPQRAELLDHGPLWDTLAEPNDRCAPLPPAPPLRPPRAV